MKNLTKVFLVKTLKTHVYKRNREKKGSQKSTEKIELVDTHCIDKEEGTHDDQDHSCQQAVAE